MSAEITLCLLSNVPKIIINSKEIHVPDASLDLFIYLAVTNQPTHDRDVLTRRLYESTAFRDRLRQTALGNLNKEIKTLCIRPALPHLVGYDGSQVKVDVHEFTTLIEAARENGGQYVSNAVYLQLLVAYDLYQSHFLKDYSPTLYGLTPWIQEQRRTLREMFHGLLEKLVQYEVAEEMYTQARIHAERWHQSLPDTDLPLQYLIWLAANTNAHGDVLNYLDQLEALGSPDLRVIGHSPEEWRRLLDRQVKPDIQVLKLNESARVEVSELLEVATEHLTGRDGALEDVFETFFVTKAQRLLTVSGSRGIGKTALAEAAAAACLQVGLIEQVIQVGITAETDFDQVLNAIARQVDMPHLAELDYRNKYVSIEQLFEGRTSLLILDQQEAGEIFTEEFKARVRAISAQVLVIICSLESWTEVYDVPLDALDLTAVSKLFHDRTGGSLELDRDARMLRTITAGSPLALKLFASAMTSSSLTLGDALAKLDSLKADPVGWTLFNWCWQLLDDPARRILASLMDFDLLEGPDPDILYALHSDLPDTAVSAALQHLEAMGLIEWREVPEERPVYRWHSLLHEFLWTIDALAQASADPQFKATCRARFCALQLDYLAEYAEDYARLDLRQRNLLHAFELGFDNGSLNLEQVNRFLAYLHTRSAFDAARRIADQALRSLSDNSTEHIYLLLNSAKLDIKRGESQIAEQQLNEALALADALGDTAPLGEIYQQLGILVKSQGILEQANKFHETALRYAREHADEKLICTILANFAATAVDRGEFDTATDYLTESLRLAKDIGYLRVVEFSNTALGVIACEQLNFKLALDYLAEAQITALLIGSVERQAYVSINAAAAYYYLGRYDDALETLKNGLSIAQRLQSEELAAYFVRFQGRLAAAQGDLLTAEYHYRQALTTGLDRGYIRLVASTLLDMGKLGFQEHLTPYSRRCFQDSLEQALELQNYDLAAEALFGLGIDTAAAQWIIGPDDEAQTRQAIVNCWDELLLAQLAALPITKAQLDKAEYYFRHGLVNMPDIGRYRVAEALAQLTGASE